MANFMASVESRQKNVSPIEDAVLGGSLCHVEDIAGRLNRTITYDIDREDLVNDSEASRRLRLREMRKPWVIARTKWAGAKTQ